MSRGSRGRTVLLESSSRRSRDSGAEELAWQSWPGVCCSFSCQPLRSAAVRTRLWQRTMSSQRWPPRLRPPLPLPGPPATSVHRRLTGSDSEGRDCPKRMSRSLEAAPSGSYTLAGVVITSRPHARNSRRLDGLRRWAPAVRWSRRRAGQRVYLASVLLRWAHHAPG